MPPSETPPTVRMQPIPAELILIHTPRDRPRQTVITRVWEGNDAGRCRLCPPGMCRVSKRGVCTVLAGEYVAPKDAGLWRFPAP